MESIFWREFFTKSCKTFYFFLMEFRDSKAANGIAVIEKLINGNYETILLKSLPAGLNEIKKLDFRSIANICSSSACIFYLFFYIFIFLFILLTHRKASKALYIRQLSSNYSDCFWKFQDIAVRLKFFVCFF